MPISRRYATIPARLTAWPGRGTTTAQARSPSTSSGYATTATSATAGCPAMRPSSSAAEIFIPPRTTMSWDRST
jgi:hypothetical protein